MNMTLYDKLKDLLERAFTEHYSITSPCHADIVCTSSQEFDLDDTPNVSILTVGSGKFSLRCCSEGEVSIIAYEHFLNQCISPSSFLQGRMKCDYLLVKEGLDGFSLLLEITSALGDFSSLSRPIYNNRKDSIRFSGGKYEKVENQLFLSLNDLTSVSEIKDFLYAQPQKACVMSYRIYPHTDPDYLMKHPFERYLTIESAETKDNGALVSSPSIESLGFEYRRICHPYVFSI